MVRAFIGLGANLGDPGVQVRAALQAIAQLEATRLVSASALYRSAPQGVVDQPDFVNAVAMVETTLAPAALLAALLAIEQRFGRERTAAGAPRTLDLDLLLYGDIKVQSAGLELPHPRMHQRAFVLAPLLEIAPDAVIPGRGSAQALLAACADQRVEKLH